MEKRKRTQKGLYIMVFDDGEISYFDSIDPIDLEAFKDGRLNIIDISGDFPFVAVRYESHNIVWDMLKLNPY